MFRMYILVFLGVLFVPLGLQAVGTSPDIKVEKRVDQDKAKEILGKGQEQWKRGELKKAILSLEEAVNLDPSNNQVAKVFKSMQFQKSRIDYDLMVNIRV